MYYAAWCWYSLQSHDIMYFLIFWGWFTKVTTYSCCLPYMGSKINVHHNSIIMGYIVHVTDDVEGAYWSCEPCVYRSVPGKCPLPGKRPCTSFQGVNVAASIQTYGNYVPGKHPCGPKSRCMFKRPWALTRDTAVYSSCRYCTVVYCNTTVMLLYKSTLVSTIVLAQNLNPILCLTIMTT